MAERIIVLERDRFARGQRDGSWIFAGQDGGRSVRIAVDKRDWLAIEAQAGSYDAALTELERMAALAPQTIDDGFGGYFVPVTLGRD